MVARRLGPNGPNRPAWVSRVFVFSFLFSIKNINKYIFQNSKNHNNYTKIIYN
jgi:hypothetical protein